MKISSKRVRMKMLTGFERCDLIGLLNPSLPKTKIKYSKVKCKHFSAVLVCFAKILREISLEKYKEFKGVNFFSLYGQNI